MKEIKEVAEIQEWWRVLDVTWKRIFKQIIDINHNPDIDEIKEILNIESVDCSKSYIVSLEPLQYLKKLRKLNCSSTNIISLEKIRGLTLIDELDISNTKVKSLKPISNFNNLWILKCDNTLIENIQGVEGLNALEYFYCSGTLIENIEPLVNLNNLKIVDCSNTKLRNIEILKNNPDIYYDGTPYSEYEALLNERKQKDSFFEEAAKLAVQEQKMSTSLIQRKLKLGYNRAGRIIDQLEAAKIIGPFNGISGREVLIKDMTDLNIFLRSGNEEYVPKESYRELQITTELNNENQIKKGNEELNDYNDEKGKITSKKWVYQLIVTALIIGILIIVFLIIKKM